MGGISLQSRLHPARGEFERLMRLATAQKETGSYRLETTDGFLRGVNLPEDVTTMEIEPVPALMSSVEVQLLYPQFLRHLEECGAEYGCGLTKADLQFGRALYATLLHLDQKKAGILEPYLFAPRDWQVCSFPELPWP